MTKILGRDDLLSGNHFHKELIEVPELEGSIYLRELYSPQVISFNKRIKDMIGEDKTKKVDLENSIELMALAVSLSACDENGNLLFNEQDITKLTENRLGMLLRLSTKVFEISDLDLNVINGLKSEVAANLKNDRTTSLSSSLPRNSTKRKRK